MTGTDITRRGFFTWTAGGALLLAAGPLATARALSPELSPWISLAADGRVTLYSTVSDMGQGSRTGQIQILADELDVPWDAITVAMTPDAPVYQYDGELLSGGSLSVRTRYDILRLAGATVRAQLTAAAAARWRVPVEQCRAELGKVVLLGSSRSATYGDLAAAAAAIPPPPNPPLKPPSERRYIGKNIAPLGAEDRVRGRLTYGIDLRLPGMLRATVRQCPTFGGKLESCDDAPAFAVPGVRKIVHLPAAVAVIADTTWAAFRGASALMPAWTTPRGLTNSATLPQRLRAAYDAGDADIVPEAGGRETRAALRRRFSSRMQKVEATYELPYLSHAPLEPMNATALVTAAKVEIWAPTQAQTSVRKDVAAALERNIDDVTVHTTFLGGGFGRRLKTDYAVLAALVARTVDVPVQLVWTRQEDLTHDFYRPAAVITYRTVIETDGSITGFEMIGATANDTVFGGANPDPYAFANYAGTQTRVNAGVPVGAWRSVDACISVFAKESFIDECAHAAGADPLDFRRKSLGDNQRALRVLEAVAERIGWTKPKTPNIGRGLALCFGWDTFIAHAIEVEAEGNRINVRRIVAAADPGTIVNPSQVRAQFEGGSLMALSAALAEEVTITNGKVDQHNFDSYPLLRFRQAPPVDVILFETLEAKVGGIGEPPIPGVAAALANAVFAATGKRVRKLPFTSGGWKV